ncbi:MAG TPA: polysaccharide deacetylase family protein [Candidatus Binatia bacterium]
MDYRKKVIFPQGKRLAVSVHFPVEWWTKPHEDYIQNYRREYGVKVGAWRLLDVFDRVGIKGTCHMSGIVAELFPDLAQEIVRRGHDVAGHGYDQSDPQHLMAPDEERAVVDKTLEVIERVTGYRPRGWVTTGRRISKDTVRILAEAGLSWHSNHDIGDYPTPVDVDGRIILDCPIQRYMNCDERRFLGVDGKGPALSFRGVLEFFEDQVDVLRGASQYEPLCFQFGAHAYMSGLPAYSWVLQRMLSYCRSFSEIWLVTTTEFAQHWLENNVKK